MTFEIGIGIFIVTIIASRIISERAMKELTIDEKAKLIDAFSGMRAYSLIPLSIIICGYFLIMRYTDINRVVLSVVYFSLIILFIIISNIYVYKKLSKLNFPATYLKTHVFSKLISFIGIGIFFYVIF